VADLHRLRQVAEREFPDLVRSTAIFRDKLRVLLAEMVVISFLIGARWARGLVSLTRR
jgi:hypothetical protein